MRNDVDAHSEHNFTVRRAEQVLGQLLCNAPDRQLPRRGPRELIGKELLKKVQQDNNYTKLEIKEDKNKEG